MTSRYNKTVRKRRVAVITEQGNSRLSFDDWLVSMGGSQPGTGRLSIRIHSSCRPLENNARISASCIQHKLMTSQYCSISLLMGVRPVCDRSSR